MCAFLDSSTPWMEKERWKTLHTSSWSLFMIQTSKIMSTIPTQLFRFPQIFIKEASGLRIILFRKSINISHAGDFIWFTLLIITRSRLFCTQLQSFWTSWTGRRRLRKSSWRTARRIRHCCGRRSAVPRVSLATTQVAPDNRPLWNLMSTLRGQGTFWNAPKQGLTQIYMHSRINRTCFLFSFFQRHLGKPPIKLTCMTSGGDPGTVCRLQFIFMPEVQRIYKGWHIASSLFIHHRYIQGASSPKDMVILVDV